MTRIAVYGAGAIGGYLGALLADAGADVTLIARGPHLAAMRENGLVLVSGGRRAARRVAATGDPGEAGEQDYVVVALKAHSASGAVEAMRPLLGPRTAVVTAANGVPWWYFHGLDGPVARPPARQRRSGRGGSGTASARSGPSDASSTPPAPSTSRASSATSRATASSWASLRARRRRGWSGWPG